MAEANRLIRFLRDPNRIVPILVGVVFMGGLLFTVAVSNSNSRNLIEIQRNTYPLLEKSTLLKIQLKSIQSKFYYAITQEDWDGFLSVESSSSELFEQLKATEPYIPDKVFYRDLESKTLQYIQLSNRVGTALIEKTMTFESSRDLLFRLSEEVKNINELFEKLNQLGEDEFKKRLEETRERSLLMLKVDIGTVVLGLMIFCGFIWYIVLLNRKLTRTNLKLEKKVEELESFVYTVSHDLKSPVVSMQGMASIFKQDYGERINEKGLFYIDRIIANAGFMEDLIQGLLLLSRAGRQVEHMEMSPVSKILQDLLLMNEEQIRKNHVDVTVDKSIPDPLFERTQLSQIFQNLFSNALKFSAGQPNPRVFIGGSEEREHYKFYVRDNGIGIDPKYHKKIFGVFQRLEEVAVEGTGIGLSIVKKIIDLAGGEIWVESQKGSGATFFFTLPKAYKFQSH
jgi:signal transduction histidine kinase